jgi:tagatose-1,6-bisphosphate aldolase non-catalytic subunit AgaZ/GatZ
MKTEFARTSDAQKYSGTDSMPDCDCQKIMTFNISRTLYEKEITAYVLQPGHGLHVSVFGGELSHIGAVSIVSPDGVCNTVQFPGHKEGSVSEAWAKALAEAGHLPVVVEAGIHYDHLRSEGIEAVVALCNELLHEVLARLADSVL